MRTRTPIWSPVAVLAGVALLWTAAVGPAAAVDVVNGDTQPHAVEVEEWGETVRFVIAPGATLTSVCLVCRVRMGDGPGAAVMAEESDVVVIRDGVPRNGG